MGVYFTKIKGIPKTLSESVLADAQGLKKESNIINELILVIDSGNYICTIRNFDPIAPINKLIKPCK